MLQQTAPNWHDHLPHIFTDSRFRKSSRRKYQIQLDGAVAGIVVAWKPVDYDNFALNEEDFGKLRFLRQEKKFDFGFVVLATINGQFGSATYVDHRDIDEVDETLKGVRPRSGPHGSYWLLRQDFLPLDAEPTIPF